MISPFGGSAKRSASSLSVPCTTSSKRFVELPADGRLSHGHLPGERRQRGGQPPRRLERDDRVRPADELFRQSLKLASTSGEITEELVAIGHEPARDERRLDSGRPRQDGDRQSCGQRCGNEPRAGVVDAGQTRIGHERHAFSPLQSRHDFLRARGFVVLVVAQKPYVDPVTLEQDARTACVLAQDEVGLAQLGEHPKRDILEVADRGGANRQRHGLPDSVEGLEADQRGSDETRLGPELRGVDAERRIGRSEHLASSGVLRGLDDELTGSLPEAASDQDHLRIEEIRKGADRRPEVSADIGQASSRRIVPCSTTLDQHVRVGFRPPKLLRRSVRRSPGAKGLHVSVSVAVPLARRPARKDDHVTDLRPSAIEPVVEDDAAADPGSEREQYQVRSPPSRRRASTPPT